MSEPPDGKLAELGVDAPRLNLGVTLRKIRDGRPPVDRERGDVNALAAIFIEETWLRAESWITANGSGLPVKQASAGHQEEFVRAEPRALLALGSSDEIMEEIRTDVLRFLDSHVEAWHQFREDRRRDPRADRTPHEAHIDKLYAVYHDAVVSGRQVSSATDPYYHVKSGLHTAVKTLINFLKVVPHAYCNRFPTRSISTAEARMIAEQSRKTMVTQIGRAHV